MVSGVVSEEERRKKGVKPPAGFFGTTEPLFGASWGTAAATSWFTRRRPEWAGNTGGGLLVGESVADRVYTYVIGAHAGHVTDFLAALGCYFLFFADGSWLTRCAVWRAEWVAHVLLYDLL